MRIDRYVHADRPTWGAASVLLLVAAIHAAGIGRLLLLEPQVGRDARPPVFEVSLRRLPPLPQELEHTPPKPSEAAAETTRQKPRLTRPVPILVDTPTTDPVPPDTQVKKYEMGDELLPGDPGPPMPEGVADGTGTESAAAPPVFKQVKPLDMPRPFYPPSCRRAGVEGRVRLRVLVGENGRVAQALVFRSSGNEALDQAALDAVDLWRFEPATRDGVKVSAWATVPIEFKLVEG